MSFDAELRDLAGRAEQAHVTSDGFATAAVKGRVRRARRVYRATVAAATVVGVGVVGAAGVAVAQLWPDPARPVGTVAPSPEPTDGATPVLVTDGVVDGWGRLPTDEEIFGQFRVTATAARDGRGVAVGCDPNGAAVGGPGDIGGFPAWYADAAGDWVQATGPATSLDREACLMDVVATPHGYLAVGPSWVVRSDDGASWEPVELPGATTAGASTVSVLGDRVTVLVERPSEAESTVAQLWTTTDGTTWSQVTDGSAAVFDNATVAQVLEVDGRLVAVGSAPGGAFVPTAAAWVSDDGLTWTRTTPDGAGFVDDAMLAVERAGDRLVAAGLCSDTAQMCAWSSVDGGRTWAAETTPVEPLDPSVAYRQATDVTVVGDVVYAVGTGFDASRPEGEQAVDCVWRRTADGVWQAVDPTEVGSLPLHQVDVGGAVVGFWPAVGWTSGGVQVLTPLSTPLG